MTITLHDNHKLYDTLGIVLYGSSVEGYKCNSDIQRHKLFCEFGMRTVLTPQWAKPWQTYSYSLRGYGIDNGAYICFQKNTIFDDFKFLETIRRYGKMSDWIAIPDVVQDKYNTIKYSHSWVKRINRIVDNPNLLIVAQDGMTRNDLIPFVKDGIGVFIGGSTSFKMNSMRMIGDLCNEYNVWSHCGRVNSVKRTITCINNGIKSCDGSGYSRFLPQFKSLFKYKRKCIRSKKIVPFNKDILTTFQERINHYKIEKSLYYFMNERNTDYMGMKKNGLKRDFWYLNWTLNQEYLKGLKNFK
jgi:hypothetical protein